MKPVQLSAVYKDGVHTVTGIPAGSYEKVALVISTGDQEHSTLVAQNLTIDAEGASWTNPD